MKTVYKEGATIGEGPCNGQNDIQIIKRKR
jgi:hypothetical protein